MKGKHETPIEAAQRGPVEFIDKVISHDEKGEPFRLAPYQRHVLEMALRRDAIGCNSLSSYVAQ